MSRKSVLISALVTACYCCGWGSGALYAGGVVPITHSIAPELSVPNEKVLHIAGDPASPHGITSCSPCPGGVTCVTLCQNVNDIDDPDPAPPEVADCSTSTRRNTYCFATDPGPDPDSNVFVEYARAWDLAAEPATAGHPFNVTCVEFFVWQLDINPALMSSVNVTVGIYQDTDGGDPVSASTDMLFLGQKVVSIPTTPSIIPTCGLNGSCEFGIKFVADFSDCPVSLPANSNLVATVAIQDVADVTGAGQGGIHIGCTARDTRPSLYRYPDCGIANFQQAAAPNPPATRRTVIVVNGELDQSVNLGSCCHRDTGICEITAATACTAAFSVYTPCGACITEPDNCLIATGACCNDMTGVCTDGVNIAACTAPEQRFIEGASCASLTFQCTSSQVNDSCAQAVVRPIPSTTHGNTRFANPEIEPDCDPEAPGVPDDEVGGVWYRVQGNGFKIKASCCPVDGGNADYDQKITVYCGTNCGDLVCVNNPTDGDDACGVGGSASVVEWCSRANRQYWINVHGFPNPNSSPEGQGHFILRLTTDGAACSDPPYCVPTGACCLNACGGCTQLPAAAGVDGPGCAELGGTFLGLGVTCEGNACGSSAVVCCPGDNNVDAVLNGKDIAGQVAAMIAPPACDSLEFCRADANEDHLVNTSDIGAFVARLLTSGPGCSDNCATPTAIASNSVTIFSNNGATESATDPDYSCYFTGTADPAENTVWFSFTATHASIRINTCGAPGGADPSTDTLVAIREGACGTLTELACAEDECGATGFLSELCYDGLTVGNTYLVEVASFGDLDAGTFRLELVSPANPVCPGPPPPPITNDSCAAPGVFNDGLNYTDTGGASTDGTPFTVATPACFTGFNNTIEQDVWATYTATCTGTLTLELCDENPGPGQTNYDSRIAVYNNVPCAPAEADCLGCTDDCGPSFSSLLQVPVVNGNSYLVRIGGFGVGDVGLATINITCSP